jgi:hypothetical protein
MELGPPERFRAIALFRTPPSPAATPQRFGVEHEAHASHQATRDSERDRDLDLA